MPEILFTSLIYTIFGLPFVVAIAGRTSIQALLGAVGLCLVLVALASINFEYGFVDQKFASQFAFDIYLGRESVRSSDGFILQYLLCLPAFALTNVWWAAIGVNVAAMALLYAYIASFNQRLALFMLAPAIVNFSMFSLRDPLIGVLFFSIALTISTPNPVRRLMRQAGAGGLFLLVRPENILIIVGAHLSDLFVRYRRSSWIIVALPIVLVGAYVGLTLVPRVLGLPFSGSILDLPIALSEFYENRATRWGEGDGGGSNILDGRLSEIPFLFRYPIQIVSFFFLPLPMDLDRPALALAALDSCVFCGLAWWFHRRADARAILLFWCYVLMVALFMSNYGNAFRLRMPSYMIMLGGSVRK